MVAWSMLRQYRQSSLSSLSRHLPYYCPLPIRTSLAYGRTITSHEKPMPEAENAATGPNQDQLPHVSEEAAAVSKTTGETEPALDQGTPVQDVLERDQKAQDNAPKVLKEDVKQQSPKGSRPFSTSSRRRDEALVEPSSTEMQFFGEEGQGHIFGLPKLPLASGLHLKYRYEPIVEQVTKLMMQDGKLSIAQRTMAVILQRLRTATPPSTNPTRPLVPGTPPPSHLPLDPVAYLTTAIDSVAPLLRIKALKGLAGGGAAVQMPVPLNVRQRRRTAFLWIMDTASKRPDKGLGNGLANKIADELIAVVEGRSGVWEKRNGVHRLGVSSRANLRTRMRRRR